MSKRPKTANSFMSRLRRPAGRLRDLPIWSKLGLIMIVPTVATIVVGTNGLIDHIGTADNADRARDLAVLTETSGELVHHLQNERAAAVLLLGAQNDATREKYRTAYDVAHRRLAAGCLAAGAGQVLQALVDGVELVGEVDRKAVE